MARSKSFSIPGLSFSWKRALGITQTKQKIARKTGIPTTILVLNVKLENDIEVHIWNVNANKFVTIIHYTMIFK